MNITKVESRTAKSIRNSSFVILNKLISLLASFFVRTVIIHYLGASILGIEGLFSSIILILSLADLGITTSMIYLLYKPLNDNDEKQISAIMNYFSKFYNIIGIIILLVGLAITPLVPTIVKLENPIDNLFLYYILTIISTASTYLFASRRCLFEASQNAYINNTVETICNICFSIIKIILIMIFKNYTLYLISNIANHIITNLIIYIISCKSFQFLTTNKNKKLNIESRKVVTKNIKASLAHNIGGVLVTGTDNLLISIFVGTIVVGYYSNYALIISTLTTFIALSINSLTPSVGNLLTNNTSPQKGYNLFKLINFLAFWLICITTVCMFCLFNEFILIWTKNVEYVLSLEIVFVLCFNYFITLTRNSVFVFVNAGGYFKNTQYKPYCESIINLIISIVLVLKFGVIGIFIGTTASLLLTFWIDPKVVYKKWFKQPLLKYILVYFLRILLCLTIGCICFFAIKSINIKSTIVDWLVKAAICLIISNLILFAIYFKNPEFKKIVSKIKSKIKKQ